MLGRVLRRLLIWTLGLLGGLVLLLALAVPAGLAWVSVTPIGARWALEQALAQLPGGGEVEDVRGTWLDGLTVGRLTLGQPGVELADLFIDIEWRQLLLGHLAIADLNVRELVFDPSRGVDDRAPPTDEQVAESIPVGPADLLRSIPVLPVPIDIRRIQIGQIHILGLDGLPELTSSELALTLQLGIEQHRVVLERALLEHAQLELALRGRMTVTPQGFPALKAELDGNVRHEDRRGVLRLDVLASPDAGGQAWLRVDGEGLSLEANGAVALDHPVSLRRLDVSWRGLNPADWFPSVPQALLRGRLELLGHSEADTAWRGVVEITNDRPGAYSESSIPLSALRSRYSWHGDRQLELEDLELQLPGGSISGHVAFTWPGESEVSSPLPESAELADAQAQVSPRAADLGLPSVLGDLQVQGLDLSVLHAEWPSTSFEGSVEAQTDARGRDVQARIALRSPATDRFPAARLEANLQADLIERFAEIGIQGLRLQDLRIRGHGQARWAGAPTLEATVDVSGLRPEQWVAETPQDLALLLDGRLQASVRLEDVVSWSARVNLAPTARLQGQTLAGQISAHGRAADVRDLRIELSQGEVNRLQASWQGGLQSPKVQAELQLERPDWWLQHLSGRASLHFEADADRARMTLASELSGWTHGLPLEWTDAPLKAQWDASAQRLSRRPDAPDLVPWQVDVSQISLEPAEGFLLRSEGLRAELQWSSSDQRVQSLALDPAELELTLPGYHPIELVLSGLQLDPVAQQWLLAGHLTDVPLDPAAWQAWSVGKSARLAPSVLRAQASWQLEARPELEGQIEIRGVGGELTDLTALGFESPSWTVQARLAPQAEGHSRLVSELLVQAPQLGVLRSEGELILERDGWIWRPNLQDGLSQRVRFDFPRLDWLGDLTDGVWITRGRLHGDVAARLQGGEWSLLGTVHGEQLDLIRIDEGIRLTEGRLDARLDGSNVILETLHFPARHRVLPADAATRDYVSSLEATEGGLWVKGSWGLETRDGQFELRAQHFPVIQRVDRYLSTDAELRILVNPRELLIEGQSRVQFGYVNLGEEPAPTLSNDVLIETGEQSEQKPPLSLRLVVDVGLGEGILLRGQGLSTTLTGQLQLRSTEFGLQATGELEARDGFYQAYGQRLTLRRGRIVFAGPIADPVLDIVALRPGARVEAGVQVSGTGRRPQIRLISEPEVPDLEKLSWILLGQGPDEMRTSPNPSFLIGAAMSLLGQEEGLSFTRELGLDELSIRQAGAGSARGLVPSATVAGETLGQQNDLAREFLVLGKRLSDPLYLTLESALNGRESLLRLSYRVSDRLSLAARTGTVFGVDLVWRILFDD